VDWALLIASIALVLVTIVYAIHTRAMVTEMRETRLLGVRPQISLAVNMRSATVGEIEIVNLGHGPAVEPRLTLRIAALEDERPWSAHVLAPGESVGFMLEAAGEPHKVISMQEATDVKAVVVLEGTTRDLYGVAHAVTDTFDLASWWQGVVKAQQSHRDDPVEVGNRELKKLREAAEGIAKELARHRPRPDTE
jgi:hypothetical protein